MLPSAVLSLTGGRWHSTRSRWRREQGGCRLSSVAPAFTSVHWREVWRLSPKSPRLFVSLLTNSLGDFGERGLAPVPEISETIRQEAFDLHRLLGGVAFRERLAELDPAGAQRLFPGDRQRLVRAYEVVRATGIPLAAWQRR